MRTPLTGRLARASARRPWLTIGLWAAALAVAVSSPAAGTIRFTSPAASAARPSSSSPSIARPIAPRRPSRRGSIQLPPQSGTVPSFR